MALVSAKCTNCGGKIKVDDTKEAGICERCGAAFITEKAINNYITNYNTTNNITNNTTNNITKIVNGKDVDDAEELFDRGVVFFETKDYEKAVENFEKAIEASPKVAKYYFYWLVAKSENFNYCPIDWFLGFKPGFYIETHKIEAFFKFTTPEECSALSKEFDIDLNNGYEGMALSVLKKYCGKKGEVSYAKWIGKLQKDGEAYNYLIDYVRKDISGKAKKYVDEVKLKKTAMWIFKDFRREIEGGVEWLVEQGECLPVKDDGTYAQYIIAAAELDRPNFKQEMEAQKKAQEEKKLKQQKLDEEMAKLDEKTKHELPLIDECVAIELKLKNMSKPSVVGVIVSVLLHGLVGWFVWFLLARTAFASTTLKDLVFIQILVPLLFIAGGVSFMLAKNAERKKLEARHSELLNTITNKPRLEAALKKVRTGGQSRSV